MSHSDLYRLIIQTAEPLNASFCEAVVDVLGQCEVLPYSDNYCVIEGFKMDCSEVFLNEILEFNKQSCLKGYLANKEDEVDLQIQWLKRSPEKAFWSVIKIEERFFYSTIQFEGLYCAQPWSVPEIEEF